MLPSIQGRFRSRGIEASGQPLGTRSKVLLSWTTPATASEIRARVARWYRSMPGIGRAKLLWEQLGFDISHRSSGP